MKSVLALLLLLANPVFGQAWDYIGIPYPTVTAPPDEIMPTLPDGEGATDWPYDPCTIATPTFSNGASQYYVDSVNGDDETAGNSGRGSVANPRETLPNFSGGTWTLSAGDEIFLVEGSQFDQGSDITLSVSGTSASKCWIIGTGDDPRPRFNFEAINIRGDHLLMDNLLFYRDQVQVQFGDGTGSAEYCTMRNCEFRQEGTASSPNKGIGGRGVSNADPSEFIMIYNNYIHDIGYWDRVDNNATDAHAIQPVSYTRHWWIINNTITRTEGDGVQIFTSNQNDANYDRRPHYIYVAGNDFSKHYEQAFDGKNGYHIFFHENSVHDCYNEFVGSNKTAVLLTNNDEGWLAGYYWACFNTIWDVQRGIRMSGSASETVEEGDTVDYTQTAGMKAFIIGNVIEAQEKGLMPNTQSTNPSGLQARQWAGECWWVNNTVVSQIAVEENTQIGTAAGEFCNEYMLGNIFVATGGASQDIAYTDGNSVTTQEFSNNVVYNLTGSATVDTADIDTYTGNTVDTDPQLFNPLGGQGGLTSGGPADDKLAARPACYATFNTLYGIDIAVDKAGNALPTSNIAAGAYQPGSVSGNASATSISVSP